MQVKSIRGLNYIFFRKDKFALRANLLAAVVLLIEEKPPLTLSDPIQGVKEAECSIR